MKANCNFLIFTALMSSVLLFSCTKDETCTGDGAITFQAYEIDGENSLCTKGAQKAGFVDKDSISVYAWKSTGDVFSDATKYFDAKLGYDGSAWTYSPTCYYSEGEKLFFRALYPMASASTNGISISEDRLTITYTTPEDVANQPDMLVASVDGQSSGTVSLSCSHALTSVKFVVGSTTKANFRLTKIVFDKIWKIGSFDYSTWTPTATGSISYGDGTNAFYTQASQAAGTNMLPNEYCFMLLPQSLASTSVAKIQIMYLKPDGTAGQSDVSLASKSFEKGKSYTYSIDYKEEDKGFAAVSMSNFTAASW